MTKGRKPLPTFLRVIKGNTSNRPLNDREAKVKKPHRMPTPPDHLTIEAKAEWNRVAQELYDVGLLTSIDRTVLAAYCQAYGRWEIAEKVLAEMARNDERSCGLMIETKNGNLIQNPVVGSANAAMREMMRHAIELGMTPSSRSRIRATPPDSNDDPAAKYL